MRLIRGLRQINLKLLDVLRGLGEIGGRFRSYLVFLYIDLFGVTLPELPPAFRLVPTTIPSGVDHGNEPKSGREFRLYTYELERLSGLFFPS